MSSGHRQSRFDATQFLAGAVRVPAEHGVPEPRFRQVLVPTSLNVADVAALHLGFELASLHHAAITVLHVLPPLKRESVHDGLDVIGLLHDAADELQARSAAEMPARPVKLKLCEFVRDTVSQRLRSDVTWGVDCRRGKVGESIASYANDIAADLVILSAKPPRWWLPITPHVVRTIEARARAGVIVVRQAASRTVDPRTKSPGSTPKVAGQTK